MGSPEIFGLVLSVVAGIFGFIQWYQNALRTKAQIRQTEQTIEYAKSQVESQPEKSKPAWDLARATLELYFNRNLSQIGSIFWLSVAVMLVGFAIVGFGISLAIAHPETAITPASL